MSGAPSPTISPMTRGRSGSPSPRCRRPRKTAPSAPCTGCCARLHCRESAALRVDYVGHGMTTATNALIQRTGGRIGFRHQRGVPRPVADRPAEPAEPLRHPQDAAPPAGAPRGLLYRARPRPQPRRRAQPRYTTTSDLTPVGQIQAIPSLHYGGEGSTWGAWTQQGVCGRHGRKATRVTPGDLVRSRPDGAG